MASTNDYVGTAVPQGAAAPHGTEVPQVTEVSQGIHDKVRTTKDVTTDDRKRDFRNAERRRIIKRHTSERKNSLLDSLTTAKLLIYGHSKNKEFEKKASERRRVIKGCESELLPQSITFADEIQTACSVIVPKWNHRESLRKSKEKCQAMKNQFSGKRKPSLTEEIKFAREIIVDSERRKYEIPAEVIEEVGIPPGGGTYILEISKLGCATGPVSIFTTGLIIVGFIFNGVIRMRSNIFRDFGSKKILVTRDLKMGRLVVKKL